MYICMHEYTCAWNTRNIILTYLRILEGAGQISLREAKKFLIHFLVSILECIHVVLQIMQIYVCDIYCGSAACNMHVIVFYIHV